MSLSDIEKNVILKEFCIFDLKKFDRKINF